MTRRFIFAAAFLASAGGAVHAASEGEEAYPTAVRPAVATKGDALFAANCAACHDARGFGTRVLTRRVPAGQAELIKRDSLPAPFVVAVVRNGLGAMPAFRVAELDDAQLALIAAYLEGQP